MSVQAASVLGSAVRWVTPRLALRLLALAALLILYYASDWVALRLLVRSATAAALHLLGHQAVALDAGSELLLLVDAGRTFSITANCSYADLVLTLAPFVWRFGIPFAGNALRLALLAAGVFTLNIARLVAAVRLHELGLSWHHAHHLPDVGLHVVAIAAAVLLALRSDSTSG